MGEVLAAGLLRAGWGPDDLTLSVRRQERLEELERSTGVTVTLDSAAASSGRAVVVVAVKPRDVSRLLEEIGPIVTPDQVVVSLAAGVPVEVFERTLGAGSQSTPGRGGGGRS